MSAPTVGVANLLERQSPLPAVSLVAPHAMAPVERAAAAALSAT